MSASVKARAPKIRRPKAREPFSTRRVMIASAIGAAFGILLIPVNLLTIAITATLPILVTLSYGFWGMAGLLALALLRRPGVGVMASTVSGIVAGPASGFGWAMVPMMLGWGVFIEAPFWVTRYRRFSAAVFIVIGLITGVLMAAMTYPMLGLEAMRPAAAYLTLGGCIASATFFAWLVHPLAGRLVESGIAPPAPVRESRRAASTDAVAEEAANDGIPLRTTGLRVRYHGTPEWIGGDGLDLSIAPGEFVVLLGPSGCGKSTLALALNGVIPHSVPAHHAGIVTVFGQDTRRATPAQLCADVALVGQDPDTQIVCDTLIDEVSFALQNLGHDQHEIDARALDALIRVGLVREAEDVFIAPGNLSGGGRQRLAVACALALRPRALILDEPTAHLDSASAHDFYRLVRELAGDVAVLLIEHDLDEAITDADRVIVLDSEGNTRIQGSPAEVFVDRIDEVRALGVWRPPVVDIAQELGLDIDLTATPTVESLAAAHRGLPVAPTDPGEPTREPASVLIEIREATVRRGATTALDEVGCTVRERDFLAVCGVTGAGKSTLAQALAGLTELDSGTVTLTGRAEGPTSRQVGYVFQNPEHQFVTTSVYDELAHGLRLRGEPEDAVRVAVDSMLDRFGLALRAQANPFTLSHGQKRRLSVGTAVIGSPELLILDEPTFGQDPAHTTELIELLHDLRASGTTIVVVSHDLQLVADHAERMILLAEGRLLAEGPVGHVLCDDALLAAAGLRPPPMRRFAAALDDPGWDRVYRLRDLERVAP